MKIILLASSVTSPRLPRPPRPPWKGQALTRWQAELSTTTSIDGHGGGGIAVVARQARYYLSLSQRPLPPARLPAELGNRHGRL